MLLQRSYLALFVCAAAAGAAPAPRAELARATATFAHLPLRFEANQGQFHAEVRYAARAGGDTVFLTPHGPVLTDGKRRVDLFLAGSNPTPALEALDQLPSHTNYFVGSQANWHTAVALYARVAYRSVYPQVDAIYYGNGGQLEYDFVLGPGADPGVIKLRFQGASRIRITPEGDLSVESGDTAFLQKRPMIYQKDPRTTARRPVNGRYVLLRDGLVGLRIGRYDRSQPLVIDPVLEYGTFLGGSQQDAVTAIQADSHGRIVLAGYTQTSDLPVTGDALQTSNNAATDCFVAILDPNASGGSSLVYLTYLGGDRDDSPTAMVLDSANHIFITGTTTSSTFPLAGNSIQTSLSLSTSSATFLPDAFVAEIFPNQPVLYSTYYGGTGSETPYAMDLDSAGNIYIEGTTTSTDLPVTGSAYAAALWGPSDMFFLKIDPNSTSAAYATYLGGAGRDDGRALVVDSTGLAHFAASTFSTQFPLAGPAYRGTLVGSENLIIGTIDTSKSGVDSLRYATYFGGSALDEVRKMILDSEGRLVLTGWTLSTDFPTTVNAMELAAPGNGDAFVLRVNPGATPDKFIDYSTFLGGADGDVAYDIATDSKGALYVVGYTLSDDFPTSNDAEQIAYGNGIEGFLAKIDTTIPGPGALLYGTYIGQEGVHVPGALTLTADGTIFVAGYTTQKFNGITGTAFQGAFGGGYQDGFVYVVQQPGFTPSVHVNHRRETAAPALPVRFRSPLPQ